MKKIPLLPLIFIVALLARFFCSGVEMKLWVDSHAYLLSTKALLSGHWANFHVERTPGFPLFMLGHLLLLQQWIGAPSETMLANSIGITHALLGIATALLMADMAQRLFNNRIISLLIGFITALSPNLILAEHSILTETLYGFSQVLALWWWVRISPNASRWQLMLLGLLSGWLIWIRPIGLLFAGAVGWVLWQNQHAQKIKLIAFFAPILLFCGLWVGFQYQTHHILGLSAGGGINQLYKTVNFVQLDTAEHAAFKQLLRQRMALYPESGTFEAVNDVHILHLMNQKNKPAWEVYLADDATARAISLEAIGNYPVRYLGVTLSEFYKLLSEPTDWDPYLLYWMPLLLLGVTGSIILWRQPEPDGSLRLLILTYWSQMVLYPVLTVTSARYRVPLEPMIILLGVYAFYRLWVTAREAEPAAARLEAAENG